MPVVFDALLGLGTGTSQGPNHMVKKAHNLSRPSGELRRDQAFSLIEALVASTLLGVVVLAVISAVSAAQSLSFEGQKLILASMSADDLMAELVTIPYGDLKLRDGVSQPIGGLATMAGDPYPSTFWALGRAVSVAEEVITEPDLGVSVRGLRVRVTTRDEFRDLVSIETFIPEPAP